MTAMTTAPSLDERGELYCATCERHFALGPLCPDDGTALVRLTAAADPLLGRELDGRFTIIEKLGQGGMGAVYRARQHSMGREVAIKVLTAGLVSDPTSIKRFLREAKLASRLNHPNVVSVLDFGQTQDGVFYLVMELVEGQTLEAVLRHEGPLPVSQMVRIATQICDALDGAHALPIVHRDLKPANVMVLARSRDHVKVLDFGLAKSLSTENTGTVTSAGALLGTPAFMPPEVAKGLAADHRADLYSLGCMMYVMGTGHPPFVTDSVMEMIALHGSQTAPPMTRVPEAIAAVIDRLLQKDPDLRYQTATAVRAALEDAYELSRTSRSVPALPASGPPAIATPVSGRPSGEPLANHDDTIRAPGAPPPALAWPEAPSNRRARRRRGWLVAILLGGAVAGAVALARMSSLPEPDRREAVPIVEPPLPRQPAPPPVQPAPPSQPPAPPVADPEIAPASDPASDPAPRRSLPDPVGKRRGERPTKRKKPGAKSKTITVPASGTPQPPTLRPSPPGSEPSGTGSGSDARPGAGSNAPF